eukprot:m.62956 g.62956  ORF g.62956 m.62956 type:complete len:74 (+) comp35123_c0_seq19:274-495(+)
MNGFLKELRGKLPTERLSVIVFSDEDVIGDAITFFKWAEDNFEYKDFRPLPLYSALAKEAYKERFSGEDTLCS